MNWQDDIHPESKSLEAVRFSQQLLRSLLLRQTVRSYPWTKASSLLPAPRDRVRYSRVIQQPPRRRCLPSYLPPVRGFEKDGHRFIVSLTGQEGRAKKMLLECMRCKMVASQISWRARAAQPPHNHGRPRDWRRPCRRRRRRVCIPMQLHCAMGAYVY